MSLSKGIESIFIKIGRVKKEVLRARGKGDRGYPRFRGSQSREG